MKRKKKNKHLWSEHEFKSTGIRLRKRVILECSCGQQAIRIKIK